MCTCLEVYFRSACKSYILKCVGKAASDVIFSVRTIDLWVHKGPFLVVPIWEGEFSLARHYARCCQRWPFVLLSVTAPVPSRVSRMYVHSD